jgi:glycosidase
MWMVGEVFERDAAHTSFFIGGHKGWDGIDTNLDSDFDFPVWNASLLVFTNKLPMRALRDQLKYDALYPDPSKITTFINNHDTARFMSLEGGTIEGAMLHMAFTLSIRGTPQLYYGEEIGMEGKDDPDNRHDFPGGWAGDAHNAFTPQGRTAREQRMYEWTHEWLRLRREHSAIRRGQLIDLFYDDDAYVFARRDATETVIIAINRSDKEKKVTLPVGSIGLRDGVGISSLIGVPPGAVVSKGLATVTLAKNSASALLVR